MRKKAQSPAQQTVAEVIETRGAPLWVRLWLERYAAGDEVTVTPHGLHNDPATEQIARLVYDVLETDSHVQFAELDDHSGANCFPHEARNFVEEWLYRITEGDAMLQPWGNSDMATIALTIALDTSAGPLIEYEKDPTLAMLRGAVKALTTKAERRAFLRDTDTDDDEPEKESTTNRAAAFKLARVLADPRTPQETWWHLRDVLTDFSAALELDITHPALVRRAFQIMCEARPKGKVRELRALRRRVLDALDAVPEMPEEKGGAQ